MTHNTTCTVASTGTRDFDRPGKFMNIKKLIADAILKRVPAEVLRESLSKKGVGPHDVIDLISHRHGFRLPISSTAEVRRLVGFVEAMEHDKYSEFGALSAEEFAALKARTLKVAVHYESIADGNAVEGSL